MKKIKEKEISRKINPFYEKNPIHNFPVFSFQFIQKKRHVENLDSQGKTSFLEKMCQLSKLSWSEIRGSQRKGCGSEKIERKCLKFEIPTSITEDIDIIAFKYNGKLSMVGFRTDNIFHILGIDASFNDSCYDHGGS